MKMKTFSTLKTINLIWLIIKGYSEWIWYEIYPPYKRKIQIEAKRRIKLCENCQYFLSNRTCDICGCYMDVKVTGNFDLDDLGKSINGCPEKIW